MNWGLGFGVWGLGFGVWSLEFGVWSLEFGVCRDVTWFDRTGVMILLAKELGLQADKN